VCTLLCAIARLLQRPDDGDPVSGATIANVLYTLQSLSDCGATDGEETRSAVESATRSVCLALTWHVRRHPQLSGQDVGMALYGPSNGTDGPEVLELVEALTPHVQGCAQLGERAISMAMHAVRHLPDTEVVHALVGELGDHVGHRDCELLSESVIGSASLALRHLSDSRHVRAMRSALTRHVEAHDSMAAKYIGMALSGAMNAADNIESRLLLAALWGHVRECGHMEARSVGIAFYSLHRLANEVEAHALATALTRQLARCGPLDATSIGMILIGVRRAQGAKEVLETLRRGIPQARGSLAHEALNTLPQPRAVSLRLAAAVHDLEVHFDKLPNLCGDIVERFANALDLRLPASARDLLRTKEQRSALVFDLLEARKALSERCIDLHGCSHHLAEAWVRGALRQAKREDFPLSVIVGRDRRSKEPQKMLTAVRHAAKGQPVVIEPDETNPGVVIITRTAVA
jgi:hypothetical protein